MAAPGTLAWLFVAATALVGCGDISDVTRHVAARPHTVQPELCIGGEVPESAQSAEPSGPELPPDAGGAPHAGPALGSAAPAWALTDFQPQSCGHDATYGLDAFHGQVTVVALWSGS